MDILDTERRRPNLIRLPDRTGLLRWSRVGLFLSMILLAVAPLVVDGSYSVVEHTLSEAGGQGVSGAWALRAGLVLASGSVLAMTVTSPAAVWEPSARWALRVYTLALLMLAAFPTTSWEGAGQNEMVGTIHTASGVTGGLAFIIGVLVVSKSRPATETRAKVLDWTVIAAVALIPQAILISTADGLLQRLMVALGYLWLFAESVRIAAHFSAASDRG